jgi:hypothetical protein
LDIHDFRQFIAKKLTFFSKTFSFFCKNSVLEWKTPFFRAKIFLKIIALTIRAQHRHETSVPSPKKSSFKEFRRIGPSPKNPVS